MLAVSVFVLSVSCGHYALLSDCPISSLARYDDTYEEDTEGKDAVDERRQLRLAMKDSTGVYSELILLYEVPGAKGWGFCGKALLDSHKKRCVGTGL